MPSLWIPQATTLHNGCPSAGRCTWRHDSVLRHILIFLSSQLSGLDVLYGDIDGFRAIESPATTVPLDILVIQLLETKKYEVLVSDLEHRGYSTSFLALEIGALGHYSTKTISLFYRPGFHLGGALAPLDLFSPPLIEVAVILLLRSNRFLAPLLIKNNRFDPPWNDF